LADCRKLVTGRQRARRDTRPHLIDQLAIHRDAGMKIEGEYEPAVLRIPDHEH